MFFQERGCGHRCWTQVLLGGPGAGRALAPGADSDAALQRGWHPFPLPGGGGSSFARRCRLCLQVAGFALSTLGSEVRPPPPRCLHHVGREGVEMGGRDLLCRLSVANDRDLPAGLRETSVPPSSPPRVRALQTVALFENRF